MSDTTQLPLQCQICLSGHMSLLAELEDSDLSTLSSRKSRITYKKGQVVHHENTPPMGLFCIHSGKVKVSSTRPDNTERILHIAKEDEFLGYTSLISDDDYTTTATVMEEATICFIPKEDFLAVLGRNPVFMDRMIKLVCKDLGIAELKLSHFVGKSVKERLATALLMLKETYGLDGQDSQQIDINLSRKDMASIVGTSTETVIRLLSEFKSSGLIDIEGRKVRVSDAPNLAKVAHFYS